MSESTPCPGSWHHLKLILLGRPVRSNAYRYHSVEIPRASPVFTHPRIWLISMYVVCRARYVELENCVDSQGAI